MSKPESIECDSTVDWEIWTVDPKQYRETESDEQCPWKQLNVDQYFYELMST